MSHSDEIARRNEAARNWEQPRFVNASDDTFAAMNNDGVLCHYAPDTWSNMSAAGNVVLSLTNASHAYMETLRGHLTDEDGPLHLDMMQQAIREAHVILDASVADTHDDDDAAEYQLDRMIEALNGRFPHEPATSSPYVNVDLSEVTQVDFSDES